jgi:hypothetical protein
MRPTHRTVVFEQKPQRSVYASQTDSEGFLPPEPPARPLGPEVFLDAFDFDEDGDFDPRDFDLDGNDGEGSDTWWG